jgi:hypothetical protein
VREEGGGRKKREGKKAAALLPSPSPQKKNANTFKFTRKEKKTE